MYKYAKITHIYTLRTVLFNVLQEISVGNKNPCTLFVHGFLFCNSPIIYYTVILKYLQVQPNNCISICAVSARVVNPFGSKKFPALPEITAPRYNLFTASFA